MKIPIKAISLNNMYSTGRSGKRFLTKKGKEFKETFQRFLVVGDTWNYFFGDTEVVVELVFTFKDKRKRDVDNMVKACFDACTGVLWQDDSQVAAVYAEKQKGTEDSIEIQVNTPKECKSCGHYYVKVEL